jgi:hypothetical protein
MGEASASKAELLAALDAADRETRELFGSFNDTDLTRKTDESNWNVGQLAGHIAQTPWAKLVVRRLSQNRDAGAPAPVAFLLDVGNWWNVRRFCKTSTAQLLQTWSAAFDSYRTFVAALPDDVLDNAGDVPGRGRMTVAEFVKSAAVHTREHGDLIRRALSLPP